jgi:bifunctional UDP-N-acetylglucosamine pyrophosphorylase/glucosamine-1-phosphate N-acetyltransferase
MNSPLAIVMAAGKGTRMKSELPKVLCEANGRPLVRYVLDALNEAGVGRMVVVVGYEAGKVEAELSGQQDLQFAYQTEQLGTGHAVMMCREQIKDHDGPVVVVAGDSPMMQASSIKSLLDEFKSSSPACLLGTLIHSDPTGLGRIVRNSDGQFVGIVEQKDATKDQRKITEVNMSTYVFDCQKMLSALDRLTDDNNQKEYYITDLPGIMLEEGDDVRALAVLKPIESLSVNTLEQLGEVEQVMKNLSTE